MIADWDDFKSIYRGKDLKKVFEALARLLFRARYALPDSLPYFRNHAGNETETIEYNGEIIGFQSKFFDDGKIDADQFVKSLITAHEWNENQTVQLLYTNSEFGNPRKDCTQTSGQKKIQDTADKLGMKIEWLYGDNVLDLVSSNLLAYDLFFNPNLNMRNIDVDVLKSNEIRFKHINGNIAYKGKHYVVDRKSEKEKITSCLDNNRSAIIVGDGGCGKSALAKDYYNTYKEEAAIFIINGEQLCTNNVNSIFLIVDNDYTLTSFCKFYEGNEHKVLIIDSAERLCMAINKEPMTFLFKELKNAGWQFLFTARSNAEDELKHILLQTANLECETILVNNLSTQTVKDFSTNVEIELPKDEKLFSKLTIPFYLARYTDVYNENNTLQSIKAFKESLWEKKIKGNSNLDAVLREKREACFLDLVRRQNSGNSYAIKTNDLDKEALLSLTQDEIIANYGLQRYYITHDIYADFATEFSICEEYEQSLSFESFVNSVGDKLNIINAFGRILSEMIDSRDYKVDEVIQAMMKGSLSHSWEQMILSVILRSDDYARTFFFDYKLQIEADNYSWLKKILKTLNVSCQDITSYLQVKGFSYPMMTPVGSGWAETIGYMFEHDYNGEMTPDILNAYSRFKDANEKVMRKAALLSFRPVRKVAEMRKNHEEIFLDNNAVYLVCCYASFLQEELSTMIDEVVANNWVTYRSPYYEFCHYIVTNDVTGGQMAKSLPKPFMKLLGCYWKEPLDQSEYDNSDYMDRELKVFGLNKNIIYYQASAYQTPAYRLLKCDAENTIDFIISFVDEVVSYYKDHCSGYDYCEETSITFSDGVVKHYTSSYNLWNMYRGVANAFMPHLLESIHMALEKYLLELSNNDDKKNVVKKILQHILRDTQSVSLVSVVASIIMAHPKEYLEEGLLVMSDIHFLLYDQHRSINEFEANMLTGMGLNEILRNERFASNKLGHRKTNLERILFTYQLANTEVKSLLQCVFNVVDHLKEQVNYLSDDEKETAQFIIGRLDYRQMSKKEVIINEQKYYEIKPAFTDELKKISKEVYEQSQVSSLPLSLKMWAIEYAKGNVDKLSSNPYMNNIQKVMDDVKKIDKSMADAHSILNMMPSGNFLPAIVGATVIENFSDKVSEEDLAFCKEKLIAYLRNVGEMMTSIASELSHCLNGLVALIKCEDDIKELNRYADVMMLYMDNRTIIHSFRGCDVLYNIIVHSGLWNEKPEFMRMLLLKYEDKEAIETYDNLDINNADCILTVLPLGKHDETLMFAGKTCMQALSKLWVKKNKYNMVGEYNVRRFCSYHIAIYILNLPCNMVGDYIVPFVNIISSDRGCESFVSSFIMYCIDFNKYDQFWIVWDSLYSSIFNDDTPWYGSETIQTYLLNPAYLNQESGDDWFKLKREDCNFFQRVANDAGDNTSVLISILKVASTLGKNYHREFVHIVQMIILKHPNMNFYDDKKNVMFYMEKLMQQVNLKISVVRLDVKYLNEVRSILAFLKDRGSTVAHSILMNC